MECIELNWLCKHMKKVRSSQAAILVLDWIKHSFYLWVLLNSILRVIKMYKYSNYCINPHFVSMPLTKNAKILLLRSTFAPRRPEPLDRRIFFLASLIDVTISITAIDLIPFSTDSWHFSVFILTKTNLTASLFFFPT